MIGRIFWLDINTKHLHIRSLTQNVRFIHSTKIMDVKKLHEDLRCSVCTNTYTDPKQLPCLHCFCLQCLNDIQRQSNDCDSITCPECRLEFSVPSRGNLSDFPSNIRVSNMLNVLAIKERNTSEVKCGNCDEKSSLSVSIAFTVVSSGVRSVSLLIVRSEITKDTVFYL